MGTPGFINCIPFFFIMSLQQLQRNAFTYLSLLVLVICISFRFMILCPPMCGWGSAAHATDHIRRAFYFPPYFCSIAAVFNA